MTLSWITGGMHLNNIHYQSQNVFDVIQDDFSGY